MADSENAGNGPAGLSMTLEIRDKRELRARQLIQADLEL